MSSLSLYCPFCKKWVSCPETGWYKEYHKDDKWKFQEWTCGECNTVLASSDSHQ